MTFRVYDKVSWHFPDRSGCFRLQDATNHFEALMKWLHRHQLLSPYGSEIFTQHIGEDFSITSEMLSSDANDLLEKYYDEWLKTIEYGKTISMEFWDEKLHQK